MEFTQKNRTMTLSTPLGDDVLLIRSISGTEELARPFAYEMELLSKKNDLTFEEILGQNVTVTIETDKGAGAEPRRINGFVSQFSQTGQVEKLTRYRARIVPWLWFLTRTSDCRIFQEKTVPDIIKEILGDFGFSQDLEDTLDHGKYDKWEFCVQYRETAFNFISRLMEQEGIHYYFKHQNGKHTMVLADSSSAHEPVEGWEKFPFYPPTGQQREGQYVRSWNIAKQILPGKYALRDFNFKTPNAPVDASIMIFYSEQEHAHSDYEMFDYPGEFENGGGAENYVGVRSDELLSQYEQITGQANTRAMAVGTKFELTDPSSSLRDDQKREYVVVSTLLQATQDMFTSAGGDGKNLFDVSFTAIPLGTPFRPARITPKPTIQGPQTAIVTESGGNKLSVDKYASVKVKFHWDRHGKNDETSSCWIRVSQAWAGQGWGSFALPHAGHEVIVEFLEGDPDRPIITGRVYNETNKPYLDPPGNATMFTLRDHGGDRIVLDGKDGEQIVELYSPTTNALLTLGDAKTKHKDKIDVKAKRPFGGSDTDADKGIKLQTDDVIALHAGKDIVFDTGANWFQEVAGNWKANIVGSQQIDVAVNADWNVTGNLTIKIQGSEQKFVQGSSEEWTYVDKTTRTYGTTLDMFGGSKTSLMMGNSNSITLGNTNSVFVGVESSVKIGGGVSVALGAWAEFSMAAKMSISGGTKFVIDSVSADEVGPFNKKTAATKMTNALVNLIGGGTLIIKNGALLVV